MNKNWDRVERERKKRILCFQSSYFDCFCSCCCHLMSRKKIILPFFLVPTPDILLDVWIRFMLCFDALFISNSLFYATLILSTLRKFPPEMFNPLELWCSSCTHHFSYPIEIKSIENFCLLLLFSLYHFNGTIDLWCVRVFYVCL